MQVQFTRKSSNRKVGPIPVSMTAAASCPDACPLKSGGCYAKNGPMSWTWRKVEAGGIGTDWGTFTSQVAALPEGTFWRHNQAGDLPGENNHINAIQVLELALANEGKRGFTYTHKPMDARNASIVRDANERGFTINLSADTLAEADELAGLNVGPVVVILDAVEGVRADTVTPAGRAVATCPATYRDDVTCASCQLCQRQNRKVIVGFPAHGSQSKKAAAVARG